MNRKWAPAILLLVWTFSLGAGCARGGAGEMACAGAAWQPLFDGRTLSGWTQRNGAARYDVREGMIIGTTVPDTPNSFLCTDRLYGDFILEFEFKVAPSLNSGVQIRSHGFPEYNNGRVHGYQVEIDPSTRAWTGGIYDEARRAWLNDLKTNPAAGAAFKQGEWNHMRVAALGDHLRTWINGVPAADLHDAMTPAGFIALQVHATKSAEPLEIAWRNIRIKDCDRAATAGKDPFAGEWKGATSKASAGIYAVIRPIDSDAGAGRGEYRILLFDRADCAGTPLADLRGVAQAGDKDGVLMAEDSGWNLRIENGTMTGNRLGEKPLSYVMMRAGTKLK